MDVTKLFKKTLIDFLETLDKELRLSICIDKIYYDKVFNQDQLQTKIFNIVRGYDDDELEECSTIVVNKSGEKFKDVQRVIRFIESQDKLADRGKINKAINKFTKSFTLSYDDYHHSMLTVNLKKMSDLTAITEKIKEIFK